MPTQPQRLRLGDTIGIVSPASPPQDAKNIDRSVAALEKLGFNVKLGTNVRKRRGFLAGTDRERASDLMKLFDDREVRAILCVRGGHGATRLLPLLDYAAIRRNAKIFVGYSDITALHCALLTKARLISFHGPMLNSDFAPQMTPRFTLESFLRTLMHTTPPGSICQGCDHKSVLVLRKGIASGALMGGNLSLLCALSGTAFQPSFRGKVLFFEDIDEPPYRIDRMLTQLLNAGLLQQVAGIAVGINKGCVDVLKAKEYRQTVEDVLRERLRPLGVPVVCGLPFGHVTHNATLPVGARATLNANAGDLIITQAAVR